jgi:hypothetical protein
MLKNIILNLDGVNTKDDVARLGTCLEGIDAVKKFDYNDKVNILSLSYDDRELSHANYIYTHIEGCGFKIK